jgi:hypothetical protein
MKLGSAGGSKRLDWQASRLRCARRVPALRDGLPHVTETSVKPLLAPSKRLLSGLTSTCVASFPPGWRALGTPPKPRPYSNQLPWTLT